MKYAIIYNPVSGNYPPDYVMQAIKEGFSEYKIFETSLEVGAYAQARKAVEEGFKAIIACGGDGTVTETAAALIYSEAKLGIIPSGTGNMLADNLHIPLNIKDSIRVIKEEFPKKIDIGKVNDKYFTFMIGCGLNSAIIEETSREKKRRFGFLAYFFEGVKNALSLPHVKYKIKLDDKKTLKVKALNLTVANKANLVGETFSLAPDASLEDGELDLIIISVIRYIDYAHALWNIFTKKHFSNPGRMRRYKFKKAVITSKPKVKVQIDGDVLEETPITVSVIPHAVSVFVPEKIESNIMQTAQDNLRKLINQTVYHFLGATTQKI